MSKKISDYVPIFKDQGIDYVAAADAAGVATQYQVVTISGDPHTITLAKEMANTDYAAVLASDGASLTIDDAQKTTTTFQIAGGFAGVTVANVIVIGQLKG